MEWCLLVHAWTWLVQHGIELQVNCVLDFPFHIHYIKCSHSIWWQEAAPERMVMFSTFYIETPSSFVSRVSWQICIKVHSAEYPCSCWTVGLALMLLPCINHSPRLNVSRARCFLSPPDRHIDDDEQQQCQRRYSTAYDQRHGWELCLIHVLKDKRQRTQNVKKSHVSCCWSSVYINSIMNGDTVVRRHKNHHCLADLWCVQTWQELSADEYRSRKIPCWLDLLRAHLLTGSLMVQMQWTTFSFPPLQSLWCFSAGQRFKTSWLKLKTQPQRFLLISQVFEWIWTAADT